MFFHDPRQKIAEATLSFAPIKKTFIETFGDSLSTSICG